MTGTERKRAWRERQKLRQSSSPAPDTKPEARMDLLQMQADVLKSLRNEIRLKHSIAADNELSVVIPAAKKVCAQLMHRAYAPTLEAVKAHLGGKPLPKP